MVAQEILILFVKVRVLMSLQNLLEMSKHVAIHRSKKKRKLLVDTIFVRLLTSFKFYYALMIPSFIAMFVYMVQIKSYVVFLSVLLGMSLLPLYFTIVEILEEYGYKEKD